MSTRQPFALALLAAVSLAACSDDAPATAPEITPPSTVATATTSSTDTAKTGGTPTTGGGRSDTTGTGPTGNPTTGTPSDTATTQNFPASVRVHGRLLVSSIEGAGGPGESPSAPVAGMRITLFRNVQVGGKAVTERLGVAVTGPDGSYQFPGVPGGYYVLALNESTERQWGTHVAYTIGNKAEVEVTVRFWRNPTAPTGGTPAPTDSSRGPTPPPNALPGTFPSDTARGANFPASVTVLGSVSLLKEGASPRDSLTAFAPVAGVRIALFRNEVVDGRKISERIGEVTTGADGAFRFADVKGGYFVLAVNPTADKPYGASTSYLTGDRAEVKADLHFWRLP
jgi:hypothetical protein